MLPFQKWISPDLVILYITFIQGYWDYLDQLSSADNPLTTRSCTVLYWVGGILPTGLSASIRISLGLCNPLHHDGHSLLRLSGSSGICWVLHHLVQGWWDFTTWTTIIHPDYHWIIPNFHCIISGLWDYPWINFFLIWAVQDFSTTSNYVVVTP